MRLPADEPFFADWARLHRRSRRSLVRAEAFANALGVPLQDLPAIVVVGSKGKATAATYASAALTRAGLRVGTITSPPVITNRERIRVAGAALDDAAYRELSVRAAAALGQLGSSSESAGYLSPAGAYMIAGLDHLRRAGCDVFVVEAGMGGASDEVSLLVPQVVAVTPIFAEHLGILGNDVTEIANEKLGVVRPATRHVVAAAQTDEVLAVFERRGITASFLAPFQGEALHHESAEVGIAAACAFTGASMESCALLRRAAAGVRLPGRLTMHTDRDGREWLVDAAIDVTGVAAAVSYARDRMGSVDLVLVSLPDGKDVARTAEWLNRELGAAKWLPVIPRLAEHLSYSQRGWGRELIPWQNAGTVVQAARTVVAAGSWSFMSDVLAMLGVDCERAF